MVLRQKHNKAVDSASILVFCNKQRHRHDFSGSGVLEVCTAVTLLIILALLLTNIALMTLARNFNAEVCSTAAKAGASAAAKGADHHAIARCVVQAINDSSLGGVLIERPSLFELHFDSDGDRQRLIVGTTIRAKVPAPILIWRGALSRDGMVVFSKTCIINIKSAPA
jgi:hypothetical protein